MKDDVIRVESQLNCLYMTYDPRDWESIISNAAQDIPTPDVHMASTAKFPWLEIQAVTELHDGSLVVRLPDVPDASCSVAHVSLSLDKPPGWIKKSNKSI